MAKKNLYNSQKSVFKTYLSFFLLLVFVLVVGVSVFLTKKTQDVDSQASALPATCGKIEVKLSTNGRDVGDQIIIDEQTPRYFLHIIGVNKSQNPCSVELDVKTSTGAIVTQWKNNTGLLPPYKTDENGVAVIEIGDLVTGGGLKSGTYTYSVKPTGKRSQEWSNEVTVVVLPSSKASSSREINFDEYFVQRPGSTYIFSNKRADIGDAGLTRLQIEEKIEWCGQRLVPWLFQKENMNAYWDSGRDMNMRWMITDGYTSDGFLNSPATLRYKFNTPSFETLGMLDSKATLTSAGQIPNYAISKQMVSIPAVHVLKRGINRRHTANLDTICPDPVYSARENEAEYKYLGWIVRKDFVEIAISNPQPGGFNYSGEALKIDFYEFRDLASKQSLYSDNLLRESWYLVKDVGLVKIEQKVFNGYPTYRTINDQFISQVIDRKTKKLTCKNQTTNQFVTCSAEHASVGITECAEDTDCLKPVMSNPDLSVTLQQYFNNPQLTARVYTDPSNVGTSVTVTAGDTYYLDTGTNYTGYLEVKVEDAAPVKWLYADNGIVTVPTKTTLRKGVYLAQFRIWVPDETHPGEKRVTDTNIPWSNQVSVTVR